MSKYFDETSGGFIYTWLAVIVIFIILNLCWAIFSPIMNQTFAGLVDQYAYNNAQLLSAKTLVMAFFNIFPWIFSMFLLGWAVIQTLRREEDQYRR